MIVLVSFVAILELKTAPEDLTQKPCVLIDGNYSLNADASTTESWRRWCYTRQAEYIQSQQDEEAQNLYEQVLTPR